MLQVIAFYKFCRIDAARVAELRAIIFAFCEDRGIRGLLLLGPEGCNGTMAGLPADTQALLDFLQAIPEIGPLTFKSSECDAQPFDKLKVDERREIVTLNRPDIFPGSEPDDTHLSPEEWHRMLTSGEDFVLIDTRNAYETEIGMFRNSVDPHIDQFSDFPAWVKESGIPRDKTVLMYCTGGIRCEKASIYMKREGYQNVFQLDGGILNYLAKYPEGEYEGECFVFDQRVAVDRNLKASRQWTICPHCGDPARTSITCAHCSKSGIVCSHCAEVPQTHTCSKNCAHHYALRHPQK